MLGSGFNWVVLQNDAIGSKAVTQRPSGLQGLEDSGSSISCQQMFILLKGLEDTKSTPTLVYSDDHELCLGWVRAKDKTNVQCRICASL